MRIEPRRGLQACLISEGNWQREKEKLGKRKRETFIAKFPRWVCYISSVDKSTSQYNSREELVSSTTYTPYTYGVGCT